MALDNIKKIQTTEATTPTPQKTDAGTASVKSKPISFESQAKTKQQSEIVDYINSDAFKKLPKAEQQKQLKAKFPFMKDFSAEEIRSYVAVARETVENTKTTEKAANKTTAEVTTKEQTQKQNEIEKLALEYKQKNNIKGEIDDIIADLKSKKASGKKLSEKEQRLLDLYNHPDSKLVVPIKTLLSKEFQSFPPEQKLKTLTTAYLEQNDKKYQSLSDKEKEAYLAAAMNDITEMVVAKSDTSKNRNKKAAIRAAALIQGAFEDGKTLDDLKQLPKAEQKKLISRTENKVIKDILKQVEKQLPNNISYADKINKYAETLLSLTDPEYQSLKDTKAKEKYRKEKIDKFIIDTVGVSDWETCTPAEKIRIQQNAAIAFEYVINNTNKDGSIIESLKIFKNLPALAQNKITLKHLTALPKTRETSNLIAKCEAENLVYERLENQNPSKEEFINEILKMESEGIKLPKTLREYKKEYLRAVDMQDKDYDVRTRTIKDKAALRGVNAETYIENKINNGTNSEDYQLILEEGLESGEADELEIIRDELRAKGLSDGQIDSWISQIMKRNPKDLNGFIYKAENAKEINTTIDLGIKTGNNQTVEKILENSSGWFEDKNEIAKIGIHTASLKIATSLKKTFNTAYTTGLHNNLSKAENEQVFKTISSSQMVPAGAMADFTKTFIETAHNDSDRVFYSKSFSKINNPAVTEGLAAGAKYVTDPAAKQQYTHYVEVAARNYPPETQAAIKTALKTGEITPETLAKTTVAETSQQTSKTTSETKPTNAPENTQISATTTPKGAQANTAESGINILEQPRRNTASSIHINSATNPIINDSAVKSGNISKTTNNRIDSENTTSKTSNTSNSVNNDNYKVAEEKANLQLKETTLENIAEVKEKIDNSIKEWELKHATNLSNEDLEAIKTLAAGDAIDEYIENHPTERDVIIEHLSKAQSINEVYNILVSALGSKVHDKFIEVLASYGSADSIRSFVNSKAHDSDVIKKMYLRCNSEGLKSELLNLLPEATIREMLEKGDITTLDAVDHKILYSFLLKNLYSMTSTSFANYLKHLPLDERIHLTELRNQSLNLTPQTQEEEKNNTTQNLAQNLNPVANNPATQENKISQHPVKQDKDNVNNTQPMFAQGETVKTLANGTVITNQGTTFAGISNNTFDDEFRVVNDKPQKHEGSPIGMNDELLTPGSEEWKRKYNKQQEVPATAFTMAAMSEEDDDFGMPFGSTKVGMGQKIKKKYPSKNFRFNA